MKIAITAIAAIAGAATASPYFAGANGFESTGIQGNAGVTATITIDLAGLESWDANGDVDNTVINALLGGGAHVIGIGWDVTVASVGGSWLSEADIAFENSAQDAGVFLGPSATGAPGTETNSSGGILDLTALATPLDFFVDADGLLRIELFESYDDIDGAVDANYLAGSFVTVRYVAVPAPGALAMLGLGGIVAGRRRR